MKHFNKHGKQRFRPRAVPKAEALRVLTAAQHSYEARTNREPVKVSLPALIWECTQF